MKANMLRQRFDAGDTALGLFVFEFGTTGIARIADAAGSDFVMFDQEHTVWTGERVRTMLAAARASDTPCLVRVPASDRQFVSSVLDAGALGIMVPMVESAEQARSIVAAAKYPPVGRRGFGALYADQIDNDGIPGTLDFWNRDQLVFAQVETVAGLENVEEIAAVDGIDAVWIGQYDLTISMGIPGQFDHSDYISASRRLVDAAADSGKPAGICSSSAEDAIVEMERGYRCIAFHDIALLTGSLRGSIERTRTVGGVQK